MNIALVLFAVSGRVAVAHTTISKPHIAHSAGTSFAEIQNCDTNMSNPAEHEHAALVYRQNEGFVIPNQRFDPVMRLHRCGAHRPRRVRLLFRNKRQPVISRSSRNQPGRSRASRQSVYLRFVCGAWGGRTALPDFMIRSEQICQIGL